MALHGDTSILDLKIEITDNEFMHLQMDILQYQLKRETFIQDKVNQQMQEQKRQIDIALDKNF